MSLSAEKLEGASTPTYHEGPVEVHADVRLNRRWFTYEIDAGLVAGSILNVVFGIDNSVTEVWPYLKDFNLWQNSYDHYYSALVGDVAEGEFFGLSTSPDAPPVSRYQVVRVVPEHLIVLTQPAPTAAQTSAGGADEAGDGQDSQRKWQGHPLPGAAGASPVSPGFHVFMLNGDGGKTIVTVTMQHAALMTANPAEMTPDEAVASWAEIGADGLMKWRDIFIPNLKNLVAEAHR